MTNPYVACDLRCAYCITGAQGISEPQVPSVEVPAERIDVVLRLRREGIDVSVAAMPWIPDVTDARALIASLPKHLRTSFAPPNVLSPLVARSPFERRYRLSHVNDAYLADYRRAGRPFRSSGSRRSRSTARR